MVKRDVLTWKKFGNNQAKKSTTINANQLNCDSRFQAKTQESPNQWVFRAAHTCFGIAHALEVHTSSLYVQPLYLAAY